MISFPITVDVRSGQLSDDENSAAQELSTRLQRDRTALGVFDDYYNGTQLIQNLGIAVPDSLSGLRVVVGWPRLAVDALVERMDIQGFRFPTSVDADEDLWAIWMANQMDQESELAHLDALIFGRAFVCVGPGPCGPGGDCPPRITVESPLNMAVELDVQSRAVTHALSVYQVGGDDAATLYLPGSEIWLQSSQGGKWSVVERNDHPQNPVVPVTMLANRRRAADAFGSSEITPALRSLTQAACRTLLEMEVAREFFAAPQRYILGATEEDFVKADGTAASAWDTYIGHVLALERDEDGNVPSVGTFSAADPNAFTSVLQQLARHAAAETALPPHMLGFATENPTSGEALNASELGLNRRAERKSRAFEGAWRDVMRLALLMTGALPADADRLDVLWAPVAAPTPLETSQAIQFQVASGYLPAESEVTGERLGYTAVERARIAADRKRLAGTNALSQVLAQVRSIPPENAPAQPSPQEPANAVAGG